MTDVALTVSTALAGVGVLAGALALIAVRSLSAGLAITLDLLVAAGLLRLAVAESWTAIVTVAAVVVVRKLATTGIRTSTAARGVT